MFVSPARSVSSSSCLASSARLSLHLLQSADTSAAAAWFPKDLTPAAQLAPNVLHRWGWDVCSGVQQHDQPDETDSTDSSDHWATPVHYDDTDGSFCSLSPRNDDMDMLQLLEHALDAAEEEDASAGMASAGMASADTASAGMASAEMASADMSDDEVEFVSCTRDPLAAEVQFVGMCLCASKRRSRRQKCLLHHA